ncbi:MAG: hypothetical protein GWN61_22295 [candidate division Zixibacteria bacterium]|nr:VTT domain-containing protein [candidate division Zixibacteria bacterium]NIS48594.1 VTT domain-containing protein [candidate division Zixibacteria bacterium]NIU16665.1 VTT domain-containing protein [candidate division Zixibacteria bacterium]NIV08834.1 hypothetical protein [candidate division Zixibacteria bacterium]NIW49312.1 hypothetical protein [Gammaproteobacteria bacterium]
MCCIWIPWDLPFSPDLQCYRADSCPWIGCCLCYGCCIQPCGNSSGSRCWWCTRRIIRISGRFFRPGQAVIENHDIYEKFHRWMKKYGGPAVMVLASIPNPFFDIAGIAAGALKMKVQRFLFWCWLGVTAKMLLFAYLGSSSLKFLLE